MNLLDAMHCCGRRVIGLCPLAFGAWLVAGGVLLCAAAVAAADAPETAVVEPLQVKDDVLAKAMRAAPLRAIPAQGTPVQTTQRLSALLASGRFTANDLEQIWENRARLHGSLGEFATALPEIADRFPVLYRVSQLLAYTGHFVLVKAPTRARTEAFSLGYQIAQRAIELEPKRVEGQYWYAINLSGYAVAEGYFQVWNQAGKILAALDSAVAAEPRYFFAGPYRARGLLLFKMPPVPFSVGDRSKGLGDLRQAVALGPEVRLNRLALAEALAESGNGDQARRELGRAKSGAQSMGAVEEAALAARLAELKRKTQP